MPLSAINIESSCDVKTTVEENATPEVWRPTWNKFDSLSYYGHAISCVYRHLEVVSSAALSNIHPFFPFFPQVEVYTFIDVPSQCFLHTQISASVQL